MGARAEKADSQSVMNVMILDGKLHVESLEAE